jgi:hypothetical protein
MRKQVIRGSVQGTLAVLAFFARRPALSGMTSFLTSSMARLTVQAKGIGRAAALEELGALWQLSFPAKKQVPLEGVSGNTVFAQIHTPCPLRGTGDLQACHRMMQFDREVLDRAGGQLVVLESQAEPGRTYCRVAMRMKGESLEGLAPAHERART